MPQVDFSSKSMLPQHANRSSRMAMGIGYTSKTLGIMLITALLLYGAALRIQHFIEFPVWFDELKILTQVSGSLYDTLLRIPHDWPPAFGVLLWVWQHFVGLSLEAARYLSTLNSILFMALIYRTAMAFARFESEEDSPGRVNKVGLLALIASAVMAYTIFTGIDVRAYGPMLAVGTLTFWLLLNWLQRPTRQRDAGLAVAITGLLYLSFTSLPFVAYLTLFVLVYRPRQFLRWVGIGIVVFVLVLPIVPKFLGDSQTRLNYSIPMAPFPQEMAEIARDFGGSYCFVGLLVVSLVLLIVMWYRRPDARKKIMMLGVWLLFPAIVYVVGNNDVLMKPRYLWWATIGIILAISCGFAYLPGKTWIGGATLLLVLPIVPVDWDANNVYRLSPTDSPPIRATLAWLSERLEPGDVIVIDPNCACGSAYAWDYFVPQYFPSGVLPVVEDPGDASRVWYLFTQGWAVDESLAARIEEGRKEGEFVGPWNFLLRLYEGPPSWDGVDFGEAIGFHGYSIENDCTYVLSEDEDVTVKLWFSVVEPVIADYSFSLALFNDSGELVTQSDAPPTAPGTPEQTSAWEVGEYYEDWRMLHIPANIPTGEYTLALTVYQWWDGVRLTLADSGEWTTYGTHEGYLVLEQWFVMGG